MVQAGGGCFIAGTFLVDCFSDPGATGNEIADDGAACLLGPFMFEIFNDIGECENNMD